MSTFQHYILDSSKLLCCFSMAYIDILLRVAVLDTPLHLKADSSNWLCWSFSMTHAVIISNSFEIACFRSSNFHRKIPSKLPSIFYFFRFSVTLPVHFYCILNENFELWNFRSAKVFVKNSSKFLWIFKILKNSFLNFWYPYSFFCISLTQFRKISAYGDIGPEFFFRKFPQNFN